MRKVNTRWIEFPYQMSREALGVDGFRPEGAVFHERREDDGSTLYWRDGAPWDVYRHTPGGEQGFGGATLVFELDSGEQREVKGPWHLWPEFVTVPELVDRWPLRVVLALERRLPEPYGAPRFYRRILFDDLITARYDAPETLAGAEAVKADRSVHFLAYTPDGIRTGLRLP